MRMPAATPSASRRPGGSILRTDTSATAVELVAGGLQNPYDLVFNHEGELFTADSDMEWDLGMTWYRPTRVNHVVPGAEFGWRSGWAKWPDYYYDSLPPMVEMGRGSPGRLGSLRPPHVSGPLPQLAVRLRLVARSDHSRSQPNGTAPPTKPRSKCSSKDNRST